MSVLRYLLDEHVNPRLRKAIRGEAPELTVWCVGDQGAPGLGTLDPDILNWCEQNAFVLVTNNRASMPGHLKAHLQAGLHIPGIFVINRAMSLQATAAELVLLASITEAEEYRDLISFLPIS